jgi:hypothetical protein
VAEKIGGDGMLRTLGKAGNGAHEAMLAPCGEIPKQLVVLDEMLDGVRNLVGKSAWETIVKRFAGDDGVLYRW